MELSKQEYQAVRVFHKAYRHIAESRDLAERADRGFDGGEWSSAHHAEAAEREYETCLALVAGRLGIDPYGLHSLCQIAEHEEVLLMQEASAGHSAVYGSGRGVKRLRIAKDGRGWTPEWVMLYNGRELGTCGGGWRFSSRLEAMAAAVRAERHFQQTGTFPNICEEY